MTRLRVFTPVKLKTIHSKTLGGKVRKLKADKAEKEAVDSEVAVLLELKRRLAVAEGKIQMSSTKSKKEGRKEVIIAKECVV